MIQIGTLQKNSHGSEKLVICMSFLLFQEGISLLVFGGCTVYTSFFFPRKKCVPKRNSLATIDVEIPSNATGVVYCVGGTAAGRNVTFQRWAAFLGGGGGFQKLCFFFNKTGEKMFGIFEMKYMKVWMKPQIIDEIYMKYMIQIIDEIYERMIEIQSIWLVEPYDLDISPSHRGDS